MLEIQTAAFADLALHHPENPKLIPMDLKRIIMDVHPHLIGTGIPEVAANLFLSLKPIVEHGGKHYDLSRSNGLLRGSLLKRYLLGTPKYFLDIPEFFQNYNRSDDIFSPENQLTQNVSHKLAEGPFEIDGRFIFKKGQEKNILRFLKTSLNNQGYNQNKPKELVFSNGKYKVKIETIIIDKNTKREGTLYQVKFYDKESMIFNIDIFGLPDESVNPHELRLSWTSSFFEMMSTSEMVMGNETVTVMVDQGLTKSHYGPQGAYITFAQQSSTDAFGHVLRLIGGTVFWPILKKEDVYSLEEILQQYKYSLLTHQNDDIIANEFHNFAKEDKRLKQRQETLISDCILYMTYDPFLFLILGYESHLFDHTPLGDIIKDKESLYQVIKLMAIELLGNENVGNVISLPYLSNYYKKTVLEEKQPI